jgi:hypothetical protein
MPDKLTPLIVAGLSRAAAGSWPLHGSRTGEGLFPTSAAGKEAAQKCCADGYVTATPVNAHGAGSRSTATAVRKKAAPHFSITDAGLGFLLAQVSPRQALEGILAALHARQDELAQLSEMTRETLSTTQSLATSVRKALDTISGSAGPSGGNLKAMLSSFLNEAHPSCATAGLASCILQELGRWQQSDACEDYPLPKLYRHAATHTPGLTIGAFHDVLRHLHNTSQIYLHPWTGPLSELPEPPCALLVGHEIAYYASLKVVGS